MHAGRRPQGWRERGRPRPEPVDEAVDERLLLPRGEPRGDAHDEVAVAAADAVLVLVDGTTSRTERAPRPFDQRAEPFDELVADALASADLTVLAALDEELAEELGADGVTTLGVLARAATTLPRSVERRAELLHHSAPFGVGYWVAAWDLG